MPVCRSISGGAFHDVVSRTESDRGQLWLGRRRRHYDEWPSQILSISRTRACSDHGGVNLYGGHAGQADWSSHRRTRLTVNLARLHQHHNAAVSSRSNAGISHVIEITTPIYAAHTTQLSASNIASKNLRHTARTMWSRTRTTDLKKYSLRYIGFYLFPQ